MPNSGVSVSPTLKKKVGFVAYCILMVIPLLEGLLWATGYRPYRYQQFVIESIPHQNIIADSIYGLALNEGAFMVTINDGLTYQTNHLSKFNRQLIPDTLTEGNVDLAIFGCSYTYGMGVDDSEAFPSQLLMAQRNNLSVKSYAVPGYGTVQGFLQLRQLVASGHKPDVALFNFADFHLERNAMLPAYRLHLNVGYQMAMGKYNDSMGVSKFPYVQIAGDSLHYNSEKWSALYQNWKGRESFALVNLLQTIADRYMTASIESELSTIMLFEEIKKYCETHKIRLIVAGITKSNTTMKILDALAEKGLETVDISLPLKEEKYNNLPHDSHPNKIAHRLMAEKMNSYLHLENNTASN